MPIDPLSSTLHALADPTRRALLARLASGDATVKELAAPFEITLAAVSKHLKVLEGAGLISRERDAQWRRCHLEAQPLRAAAEWLGEYQRFWDSSLDRLAEHLKNIQQQSTDSRKGITNEPSKEASKSSSHDRQHRHRRRRTNPR